jgi:HSP20 family protein
MSDFETTFSLLNELVHAPLTSHGAREDFEPSWSSSPSSWPQVNLGDDGTKLVLTADVPGMSDKDVDVTLQHDAITIRGERIVTEPAGYATLRKERGNRRFARTIALPCKVQPEGSSASVKDGVLTVTLAKAPEAQPRRIQVRAE